MNLNDLTLYQWLCLLGVPTIIAGGIKSYVSFRKKAKKDMTILKTGIQALLRAQMNNDYYRYSSEGTVPLHVKDNFENLWKHYHELGGNGVMTDIHDKFLKLKIRKEE